MVKKQFVKYFDEESGSVIEQKINDYLSKSMGEVKIVSISCGFTTSSYIEGYGAKVFVVFEKTV